MDVLAGLNQAQQEAVQTISGPLLILAGPGSGKTRVITHRTAYLIEAVGVNPYNILVVTFTNKAARELKERLHHLIGGERLKQLYAGTFHAFCAVFLRREIQHLGLDPRFVIYDEDDKLKLVRRALKDVQLDEKQFPARPIANAISRAKDELIPPEEYPNRQYLDEIRARVYRKYQELLTLNHAVDFDDLIMLTVKLLRTVPEVRERWQSRVVHMMVDEAHDTNTAQYELIKLLSARYHNICVVADPDQSIYAFRGANFHNVFKFEQDFPNAKVVKLEQNYRSTQTIIKSAHGVISKAVQRKDTRPWTENDEGVPVTIYEAYNEQDEGEYVVHEIQRLVSRGEFRYGDMAVMYRTNAQSRTLEDTLVRYPQILYRLIGGTRFYERREIKDVLAYLRLVNDPFDDVSLERVINVPPRGLGKGTLTELTGWAQRLGVPVYVALQAVEQHMQERAAGQGVKQPAAGRVDEQTGELRAPATLAAAAVHYPFSTRTEQTLAGFLHLINDLIELREGRTVGQLIEQALEKTGYQAYLDDGSQEGKDRLENVKELLNAAAQFEEESLTGELSEFLQGMALVSDVDSYDTKADAVTLLTLHSAKGLEFPVVFILGLEEGLLPHANTLDTPEEVEEERRLCYVGMTRAMRRLYLVYAFKRMVFGKLQMRDASRFLADVPPNLITGRQSSERHQPPLGLGTGWPATRGAPATPTRGMYSSGSPARPKPEPAAPPEPAPVSGHSFKPGDRVRHKMFGEGIVMSMSVGRSSAELTVAFKGKVGLKKLDLAFAPLERIDE